MDSTSATDPIIGARLLSSIPVRPNKRRNFFIQGICFSLPKQRFGPGWEKPIFCFGVPNRCFGRGKANSLNKEIPSFIGTDWNSYEILKKNIPLYSALVIRESSSPTKSLVPSTRWVSVKCGMVPGSGLGSGFWEEQEI